MAALHLLHRFRPVVVANVLRPDAQRTRERPDVRRRQSLRKIQDEEARMKTGWWATLLASAVSVAAAGEREEYLLRGAQRDLAMFRELDLDRDARLSRAEVQGMVSFQSRCGDIDIDRDGVITLGEMERYLRLTYEVDLAATQTRP
jgi:hypothetical protein